MRHRAGGWSSFVELVERPARRRSAHRIPGTDRAVWIVAPPVRGEDLPELAPTPAGARILERLPGGTARHLLAVESALTDYLGALDERGDALATAERQVRAEDEAAAKAEQEANPEAEARDPLPAAQVTAEAEARLARERRDQLQELRAVAAAARRVAKSGGSLLRAGKRGNERDLERKAEAAAGAVEALRAAYRAMGESVRAEIVDQWTAETEIALPWETVERALLVGEPAELVPLAKGIAAAATPPAGPNVEDAEAVLYLELAKVWKAATNETPVSLGGDRRYPDKHERSPWVAFILATLAAIGLDTKLSVHSLDRACRAFGSREARAKRARGAKRKQSTPADELLDEARLRRLDEARAAIVAAGGSIRSADLYDRLGISDPNAQLDLLDELDRATDADSTQGVGPRFVISRDAADVGLVVSLSRKD